MLASTRALLENIVDYAGTYPPASLELRDALAGYAAARTSPHAWLLGRLILPAALLDEFNRLEPFRASDAGTGPWQLSVILKGDIPPQLRQIESLNERWDGRAAIVSVESPPAAPAEISRAKAEARDGLEMFFETPLDGDLQARLDTIGASGCAAKVRTGGVTPGAFPSPDALAQFLVTCARRGLAFKATAGLHHAIRHAYAVTYERDSATALMHGFLNVSIASALAQEGADVSAVSDALVESSPEAFRFQSSGIAWRDHAISAQHLITARREFFRSFGSCSFQEPVDALGQLNLLGPG